MIRRRLIFMWLFIAVSLNASTLISQNTYKFRDRVEVALNFDAEFDGEIFLTQDGNNFNVLLKNIDTKEKFLANVNSSLITNFTIENVKDGVEMKVVGRSNLELDAALSKDNKTLNIKFIDKNTIKDTTASQNKAVDRDKKNTNSDEKKSNFKLIYLIFPIVLIGIFIFLYFKFKKITAKDSLFNDFADEEEIDSLKDEPVEDKKFTGDIKPKIIYNNKITDSRELLLIEKEDKIYMTFLAKDNELPNDSYKEMLESEEKFQEFLEICKNKTI